MKITLLITNQNNEVVAQEIVSEWNPTKDRYDFFKKLQNYMNAYIREYNTKNVTNIKKLETFDESGNLLTQMDISE
jgi:hypothetical protein